ncbi:MAG: hypothetical protein SGCHY_000322 [Lobulomycetales sp.]
MLAVAASSVAGKTFLLSLSESADKKDVVKDVEALGGSVQEYFKLLPLVLLVELPDGQVTTLDANPHILSIEEDSPVGIGPVDDDDADAEYSTEEDTQTEELR